MLRQHPDTLRWRQALPPLFVFGILMLLLLAPFWNAARIVLITAIVLYVLTLILGSLPEAVRQKKWFLVPGIPLAIMTMHFAWGCGFWWSIFKKN
jgi:hypothetical protein